MYTSNSISKSVHVILPIGVCVHIYHSLDVRHPLWGYSASLHFVLLEAIVHSWWRLKSPWGTISTFLFYTRTISLEAFFACLGTVIHTNGTLYCGYFVLLSLRHLLLALAFFMILVSCSWKCLLKLKNHVWLEKSVPRGFSYHICSMFAYVSRGILKYNIVRYYQMTKREPCMINTVKLEWKVLLVEPVVTRYWLNSR